MAVVLIALFAVSAVAPLLFRRFGRASFYLLGAVPAVSFGWLLLNFQSFTSPDQAALSGEPNAPPGLVLQWIPALQLELAFRMDALAAVLSLLILGVGALVLFYCARYFKNEDANIGPFGAQLLAFAGAMFGLVISDDVILLFIFWEITTILSYLLVGFARARIFARRSALQALLVTTFGGLAMLLGLVMIGQSAGTYRLSEIMAMAPELVSRGTLIDVAIALVLLGAVSKSALVPFHFWLPGAMAAPTPVSAYLHAAAMVKAGIYLVARLAPGYSDTAYWDPLVIGLGLATMLIGGWRALRQRDIKLILAYGTVSQLGFLMLVMGQANADAAIAGLAMMLAHGFFKAALFLAVGIIDHQAGTRDVRLLSGLWRTAPKLFVVALLSAASMAGIPPLYGFVAKESVLEVLFAAHGGWGTVVLIGVVLGSILTVAYSARFIWGGFASKQGMPDTPFKAVPWLFLAAPALLTAITVAFGIYPAPIEHAVASFATLFPASEHPIHLALWHGLTPVLGLSAIMVVGGLLLFRWRTGFGALQARVPALFDAERIYKATLNVIDEVAVWVTGRTQRGSLPFYLGVILLVALIVPAVAAFANDTPLPTSIAWFDTPAQLVTGLCMIVGALAAVRANKRFLAVLMVSVTGYGMAFIFALQGAPDLALTQLLVETIVLVAMVLALRVLPPPLWTANPSGHRLARAVLGIGFGLAMIAIAVTAMASRVADPISLSFPELAYYGGAGKNIVNVTLVDIRVWDTFGEITVLAVAATGVASLIFVRGRGDMRRRAHEVEPGSVGRARTDGGGGSRAAAALATARHFAQSAKDAWLVAGKTMAPESRSIIFEVVARLVFHTIILFSIYLLLAGHNTPGGGFAGGLLAGLAMTIRYLAGGRFELVEATPISPGTLLGLGLGTAALSGVVPLLLGGHLFQSAVLEFALPLFGEHKFVTATFFDIGVYLVVVGLVVDVLRSLGSEIDEKIEKRRAQSGRGARNTESRERAGAGR